MLQKVNITSEVACRVSLMNASHQELSEKYEAMKGALEKEKQENLRFIGTYKGVETELCEE